MAEHAAKRPRRSGVVAVPTNVLPRQAVESCRPDWMERCRREAGLPCDVKEDPDDSDDDGDDDGDSDAGSSANEYAEGLGCADAPRCSEQSTSGFEFDACPREEYFEQPAPHRPAALPDARVRSSATGSLKSRLLDLERKEDADELPVACTDPEAVAAARLAGIRRQRAMLMSCRARLDAGNATPEDDAAALAALRALEAARVDTAALKATGVGKEVNNAAWRRHRSTPVARVAARLLESWRAAVRRPCACKGALPALPDAPGPSAFARLAAVVAGARANR